jgi:hypothetical protein
MPRARGWVPGASPYTDLLIPTILEGTAEVRPIDPQKEFPVGVETRRSAAVIGLVIALLVGLTAREAQAQTFGIGTRMVSVSGTDSPALDPGDTTSTRLAGGFLRLKASKRLSLEVSMDYRSTTNPTETARVRTTPIQVSALFYPIRTAIAPYLLAGVGWYKHRAEALSDGKAVLTANTSEFGYHTGLGGELMLGRHASFFVDYRYVWVDVNGIGGFTGVLKSATSLTSVIGLLTNLNDSSNSQDSSSSISRRGSMWTTGLTVYF